MAHCVQSVLKFLQSTESKTLKPMCTYVQTTQNRMDTLQMVNGHYDVHKINIPVEVPLEK